MLLGWRPSLGLEAVAIRFLMLLGWKPLLLGWKPLQVG